MKRSEWDALSVVKKQIVHGQPWANTGVPDAEGNYFHKVKVPGINVHAGHCVDDSGKIECVCGLEEMERAE